MKKALAIAFGLMAAGTAPAWAADMPARTYTKAPADVAAIYNWTGFYLGAIGGYAKENASTSAMNGVFGGGTIGYNWQTGKVVVGIEADAAGGDISSSAGNPGLVTVAARIGTLGTARGRVGVVWDQVLLYGTAGYAWADTRLSATVLGVTSADSKVLSGWTTGAGAEVMFAPHWSLKAEYLYRSFGGDTFFAATTPIKSGTLNVHSGQVGVNYHF